MSIIYYHALNIKTHILKRAKEIKYCLLFIFSSLANASEFQLEYDYKEHFFHVEKIGASGFASNNTANKHAASGYELDSLSVSGSRLYLSFQELLPEKSYLTDLATITADILNYLFYGDSSNCVITTPTTKTATPGTDTGSTASLASGFTPQLSSQNQYFGFKCYGGSGGGGGEHPWNPQHTRDRNCPRCFGGDCIERDKNCPKCFGGECVGSDASQSVSCQCFLQGFNDALRLNGGGVSSGQSLFPAYGSSVQPLPPSYGGISSEPSRYTPYGYVGKGYSGFLLGGRKSSQAVKLTSFHQPDLEYLYSHAKYPGRMAKEELAARTGLSLVQISTWFANKRRRDKKNQSKDEWKP